MKKIIVGCLIAVGLAAGANADSLSDIKYSALGYKVKVAYGNNHCKPINDKLAFVNKIKRKYGNIKLSANTSNSVMFDTFSKTGKQTTYSIHATLQNCILFQSKLNKVLVNAGRDPIFPDIAY